MRNRRDLANAFRAGHLAALTHEECIYIAHCLDWLTAHEQTAKARNGWPDTDGESPTVPTRKEPSVSAQNAG